MFLIGILVFIVTFLVILNWQKHNFWDSRGIFTPAQLPILGHAHHLFFGNYRWEYIDKIYAEVKSKGFWGMYEIFNPVFYVSDPTLIRDVLVKDADCFVDRRSMKFSKKENVFNEMLTLVKGEKWKALRSIITPTFTSGKIKIMFPLINEKGDVLISHCREQMSQSSYVDMRSAFGLYTMDVIGTCAFGIDTNCLTNKDADFIKHASNVLKFDFTRLVKFCLLVTFPKIYEALNIKFGGKSQEFFIEVAEQTIEQRLKSGIKRGDFLDLMLEALEENKNQDNFKYPMTLRTVVAESVLFLLAGYDTTSNALSCVLHLLAKNHDCQTHLRKELQKIVDVDGELTYDNVMKAPYLDACLAESLRIYAIVQVTERCCTKRYRIPGTDLELTEGMLVAVPIWSLHRDPDYWEEPLKFLPDRFLPENKANIKPYTYMPFGLGPRNCVGMRFAQLESKIAIAKLCLKFEMTLQPGYENLVLDSGPNTLRPGKDGVRLVLKEILNSP